jgi:hypothetical protein
MPDADSLQLRERVWNAFPVTQPAFAKLLALLEIEASRAVPTAAVSLGVRSRLKINPDFAAAHCAEDPALVMLVLHELFHVVLGHTRLYERATPGLNFAFDAVINAQLCLLFPGPESTRLFRELYAARESPWCLLRPPEGWRTAAERWLPGAVGAIHRRLYTDETLSYEDLFRLLAEAGEQGSEPTPDMGALLGSHGEGSSEVLDPDLLAEIREIIADWPMVELRSGRDQGGTERDFRLEHRQRKRTAAGILRQALRNLGDRNGDGSGRPRLVASSAAGIFPHQVGGDRRATVLAACGTEPLLYSGELPHRAFRRGERVHVYLDVSGSMSAAIAPLYAALTQLTTYLTPALHLFSTTVKDITHVELRRGKGATTGGTDISVVTTHMLKNDVRRALVVTDGWVGQVPTEHARELSRRKGRFAVALSAGGDPAFALGLGARVWKLPDLDQETR